MSGWQITDGGKWAFWGGIVILIFFATISIAADFLALYPIHFRDAPFLLPSWAHPLGTNDMGQDILTILMSAGRISLIIGITAAMVSVLLGSIVGILAGFYSGVRGEIFTGVIDMVMLIPVLPFLVILAVYLGSGGFSIIFVIACVGWCSTARAVRAKVLQLRETDFVEALKGLGFPSSRIIFLHLLPNVLEIVFAKFILSVAGAMISEASLGFLGFGDPEQPGWGKMIHEAFQRGGFANGLWNWYLPPGICITLCVTGFVLLGSYWEKKNKAEKPLEWFL